MNIEKGIAPHETFDLHELLTMKNTNTTKSYAMSKLVKDEELKSILNQDLQTSKEHIRELQELIQNSVLASSSSFKTFKPVQTSRFAASDTLDTVKDKEVLPNKQADHSKGAMK